MPATIGPGIESDPDQRSVTPADAQTGQVASPAVGPDALRIDGQSIISVATIKDPIVIDGDSIRGSSMAGAVDFRLASIDAPERGQPFGQRAKQYLQAIVAGKELTAYQTDTDQYGRRVAFVFATLPGRSDRAEEVNAKMVADGYAWHAIRHSQNSTLAQLQATARAGVLGLWDQPSPMPPWEYRDSRTAAKPAIAARP